MGKKNAKKTQCKHCANESKTSGASSVVVRAWPEGLIEKVPGFRTAVMHCGLKSKKTKPDLALLVSDKPASAAGVFTTNLVCAAPVTFCREALKRSKGRARAVVVNAGNANACTGPQGERDARQMAQHTAKGVGCSATQVLVCSTGIIGRPMPMKIVEKGIAALARQIPKRVATGSFAHAILTTDLVPKTAGASVEIGGKLIRIAGATKGSGMIAPNMATTLGFIATDANIEPGPLQKALREVVDETYNCITVDGDTSTNDTVLALASGVAGHKAIDRASGRDYQLFKEALHLVCDDLARQIAADGEGATHTVTVYVGGTQSDVEARQIAATISNSPLVKTAIAGHDPNWGRIMGAAGRAGVAFLPEDCSLTVCGHELFRSGMPLPFDAQKASEAMTKRDVGIVLLVGDGPGRAKFYTCDFTHGYITINAEYHN